MACQGLIVFTHDSPLGNAPAHKLFEAVQVSRREGVSVPRHFSDYEVTVNQEGLPEGVTVTRLV